MSDTENIKSDDFFFKAGKILLGAIMRFQLVRERYENKDLHKAINQPMKELVSMLRDYEKGMSAYSLIEDESKQAIGVRATASS